MPEVDWFQLHSLIIPTHYLVSHIARGSRWELLARANCETFNHFLEMPKLWVVWWCNDFQTRRLLVQVPGLYARKVVELTNPKAHICLHENAKETLSECCPCSSRVPPRRRGGTLRARAAPDPLRLHIGVGQPPQQVCQTV